MSGRVLACVCLAVFCWCLLPATGLSQPVAPEKKAEDPKQPEPAKAEGTAEKPPEPQPPAGTAEEAAPPPAARRPLVGPDETPPPQGVLPGEKQYPSGKVSEPAPAGTAEQSPPPKPEGQDGEDKPMEAKPEGEAGAAEPPVIEEKKPLVGPDETPPPAGVLPDEDETPPPEGVFDVTPLDKSHPFIKGDLVYPGTRRMLSRFDHVGVSLGIDFVDNDLWTTISPGTAWYLDSGVAFSFHVPLRLRTIDIQGTNYEFGGLRVRREDWDEISDFAKVIRFITYGRKEARVYVTVNTMRPTTIGHGMLMNGYQGDIDIDRSLTGLIFDAYNDYAGFQLQLNDVTFQNQIFAGLGFVKPLSLFMDDELAKSLSLGVEYIADLKAPRCVKSSSNGDCIRGVGHAAGFDPYTGASLDSSFVRTDPDTGRFAVLEELVHAIGASVEFKFYKSKAADLKVYSTYHQYLNEGGGGGLALGMLARLNAGEDYINAFRLRTEYRTFDDGFLPSYFNTLYEIQKYAYLYRTRDYQVGPTKYQQVFGDPANGFDRNNHGRRHGFNLDAHWALFKGKRSAKQLGIGFGLQESNGPDDTTFYAHIEFPMVGWLQVFGTYMCANVKDFGSIFSERQNMVVLTGGRLRILPAMFINVHYSQSFRTHSTPGSEIHLGNDTIVDQGGNPSPYFKQNKLFENVHTFFADVEFGWEFLESK